MASEAQAVQPSAVQRTAPQSPSAADEGGWKTFNDPVHGHFDLSDMSVAVIDTPQFQRLRHLKQLGLTYFVYPGASHCRFEHSLGVAHLAAEWCRQLVQRGGGAFGREERRDAKIVELAGLVHDIGHGPFSHVFEYELLPRIAPALAKTWHHEDMSQRILDHLMDTHHIDLEAHGLNEPDVALARQLMSGTRSAGERGWLFDIVANKRNGIDVDKFDYLLRDSRCTGVAISLDVGRLMHYSRVAQDQICFKYSEYENLSRGLFQERATMHSKVYTHRKAKGIEFLVCDALAVAEPELRLSEAASDVDLFLKQDDGLLRRLEVMDAERCEHTSAVKAAQALLGRLQRRELYAFCDEVTIPPGMLFKRPTSADITSCQSVDGLVQLAPEDVIVSETHIDFAARDQNPLDQTLFYNQQGETFAIPQKSVSSLLCVNFQDHKLRIYSRRRDERVVTAVRAAFRSWLRRHMGPGCIPSTPFKDGLARCSGGSSSTSSGVSKRRRVLNYDAPIAE